ncbi:MAG: hypothetical protein ABIE74_10170 [Pseudomonadota bacterium]
MALKRVNKKSRKGSKRKSSLKKKIGKKSPSQKKKISKKSAKKITPKKAKPKVKRGRPKFPRIDWEKTAVGELAGLFSSWLKECGFDVVLVGRACAAVHAGNMMHVDRFDFMMENFPIEEVQSKLKKFGFRPVDLRTFKRSDCPYTLNFPAPPVTVGDELVTEYTKVKSKYGEYKLLNATDCVRCRLTTYYRWGDEEALSDALQIAVKKKIDIKLVERWSAREWAMEKFREFLNELAKRLLARE